MRAESSLITIVAVCFVLAAGPLLERVESAAEDVGLIESVPEVGECGPGRSSSGGWSPTIVGADSLLQGRMDCFGVEVTFAIGQFLHPRQGFEAASDLHELVPRQVRFLVTIRKPESIGFKVSEVADSSLVESGSDRTIWHWYSVGESPVANAFGVKRLQILDAIRLRRRDAAVFVLSAKGADASRRRLALEQTIGPTWDHFLSERQPR